jgi:S-adenosylmethionine:tRNA ribosyltransferase-isomerase
MLVSEFDFELPPELIAQRPLERGKARMLLLDRESGEFRDSMFEKFPEQLRAGDLLVLNDSRVIPARLFGEIESDDSRSGARVEVLLTEQTGEREWHSLVRPGKKLGVGARIVFRSGGGAGTRAGEAVLRAVICGAGEYGERTVEFGPTNMFWEILDSIGHVPLPPYIHRFDDAADRERYQTVYARDRGSVAAPTAGLHFTPDMLARIASIGVEVAYVTLHVGLGTFQPVREAEIEAHKMHAERYTLGEDTAAALNRARSEGRRVIAVGTTVARTLEHCARMAPEFSAHSGSTKIFLYPGAEFRVVNALFTNFHLPQSTLLMLVSAFAGRENVLRAYQHAIAERYRFFSYGDCMFIA